MCSELKWARPGAWSINPSTSFLFRSTVPGFSTALSPASAQPRALRFAFNSSCWSLRGCWVAQPRQPSNFTRSTLSARSINSPGATYAWAQVALLRSRTLLRLASSPAITRCPFWPAMLRESIVLWRCRLSPCEAFRPVQLSHRVVFQGWRRALSAFQFPFQG